MWGIIVYWIRRLDFDIKRPNAGVFLGIAGSNSEYPKIVGKSIEETGVGGILDIAGCV